MLHVLAGLVELLCLVCRAILITNIIAVPVKGSTCAMVEAMLRQCGYRTGLYTSPHLIDVRERIRIDG